jgi:hypothetical protein
MEYYVLLWYFYQYKEFKISEFDSETKIAAKPGLEKVA